MSVEKRIEKSRNEFKDSYKRYIIKTTGVWTPEDEARMNKECELIEGRALLMAIITSGALLAIIMILALLIVKVVI